MERVNLRMTKAQARKLMKGGTVQFSPAALRDDSHWLALERKSANKVKRAQRAGRGCRIQLSSEEAEQSGEGIREFFKELGAKAKKVINSPQYQKYVKPIVRKIVDQGLEMANPYLPDSLEKVAKKGVDWVGAKSGAYGFKENVRKGKDIYEKQAKKYVAPHLRSLVTRGEKAVVRRAKKALPRLAEDIERIDRDYGERAITELGKRSGAYGFRKGMRKGRGLANDYSNFLNPQHPAMHPVAPQLPAIGGYVYLPYYVESSGGSFKVAGQGGSFMMN